MKMPNHEPALDAAISSCLHAEPHSRGPGEVVRSSMPHHSQSASNPQGWQRVAGGRSPAETSGKRSGEFRASWRDATVLRPLRGRLEIWDRRPVVSLRSTTGYFLASLRLAEWRIPRRTRSLHWTTRARSVCIPSVIGAAPVSFGVRLKCERSESN